MYLIVRFEFKCEIANTQKTQNKQQKYTIIIVADHRRKFRTNFFFPFSWLTILIIISVDFVFISFLFALLPSTLLTERPL